MRALLLASSSGSMAVAAGATLGFFTSPQGFVGSVLCAGAAAALLAWRDRVVVAELEREFDPPPAAPSALAAGAGYRQMPALVDPVARHTFKRQWVAPCNDEFIRPEPRSTSHAFEVGEAVEFTLADYEHGDVTYSGTIAYFYHGGRARVDCAHVSVNVPLAMLTFVGDA